MSAGVSGKSVILIIGGLFLLIKSTSDIHEKVAEQGIEEGEVIKKFVYSYCGKTRFFTVKHKYKNIYKLGVKM